MDLRETADESCFRRFHRRWNLIKMFTVCVCTHAEHVWTMRKKQIIVTFLEHRIAPLSSEHAPMSFHSLHAWVNLSNSLKMEQSNESRWRRGLRDYIRRGSVKVEIDRSITSSFLSKLPLEIRIQIYQEVIFFNGRRIHIHMKHHESKRIVHSPCLVTGGLELLGDIQRRPTKREDWNQIHHLCAERSLMKFPLHPEIMPGPPFPRRKAPPTGLYLPLMLTSVQM